MTLSRPNTGLVQNILNYLLTYLLNTVDINANECIVVVCNVRPITTTFAFTTNHAVGRLVEEHAFTDDENNVAIDGFVRRYSDAVNSTLNAVIANLI